MKFAFFGYPHIGGTYTIFSNLKKGLELKGIKLELVNYAKDANSYLKNTTQWSDIKNHYVPIIPNSSELHQQGQEFVEFLECSDYDGIFINVISNPIQMNSVRYLRKNLLKIMIVHNISHGTYRAARAFRDYVHGTIGVSWRIKKDLVDYHGFDATRTYAIANAIDLSPYEELNYHRKYNQSLKILSLGRIENASKGIFWLPKIWRKIKHLNVELSIAGDGSDLPKLQNLFAKYSQKVNFLSSIPHDLVPQVFAQHDIFLFPSRYEGFGYTLIEAMAAGCVPIASKISNVTDRIISHGQSGFLFTIGDCEQAANFIKNLETNRKFLNNCSHNCINTVQNKFNIQIISQQYITLLENLLKQRPDTAFPINVNEWKLPQELQVRLPSFIPNNIKNVIRHCRSIM